MNYSGIDLHSNNSVVSAIDETDRVVAERGLPNDLRRTLALLSSWRPGLAGVVVESTYSWYRLVDGLQAAGFVVHLANTTAINKYDRLKHSRDETDARATWPICFFRASFLWDHITGWASSGA